MRAAVSVTGGLRGFVPLGAPASRRPAGAESASPFLSRFARCRRTQGAGGLKATVLNHEEADARSNGWGAGA